MTSHLHLLVLITLTIFGERYKLLSSSLCCLLHSPFSYLLGPLRVCVHICLYIFYLRAYVYVAMCERLYIIMHGEYMKLDTQILKIYLCIYIWRPFFLVIWFMQSIYSNINPQYHQFCVTK